METKALNLFIVDDDKLLALELKVHLHHKFGSDINISTFYDGESCLEKIDKTTQIVILDYFLDGKNGLDTLRLIKEKNPKTEVIMLSNSDDIVIAIETFRAGAKDYVIKGEGSLKTLSKLLTRIVTAPVRIIVKGFR